MEQMDAAAVAAWFADELELPQYAAAVKEHKVDGDVLLPSRFSEAFLQVLPRSFNEICRGWVQPGSIDYY